MENTERDEPVQHGETVEHGETGERNVTVERNVTLGVDPGEAWALVSRPDELAGWLAPEVAFDPSPGAVGEVVEHDGTRRRLVVDEVEEGARISWRWWIDGDEGPREAGHVAITLVPTRDGTRVDVVERPLPHPFGPPAAHAGAAPMATGEADRGSGGSRRGARWALRLLHLELAVLVAGAVHRV